MHCLVTGGTGFVGRHLVPKLSNPVVLGRDPEKITALYKQADARPWNPKTKLDPQLLEGVDTIFHLAGESVFSNRWNADTKRRIKESRIQGTLSIVDAIGEMKDPPKTLICASAIGYYGSRGDERLTENSEPGDGFLAEVSIAWEEEARKAEQSGLRVALMRIGVVLGKDGGALPQMLPPFKMGFGGRLGNGKQYMSWIHIDDLVGIMLYAAENESMQGPYNCVSIKPVTNAEFTRALAKALHRPAILPVPGIALRVALGEFANVLLGSQKVIPARTIQSGYTYIYPELSKALEDLVEKRT